MIPEFDDVGNLPPGFHIATWAEIETRFAINVQRRAIYAKLRTWAEHMASAGCALIHVDGSFITAKETPADFDACWDPRGVDLAKLAPCLVGVRMADEVEIKAMFGGDARIDYAIVEGSISRYIDFFTRDGRNGGRKKGILRVPLNPKDVLSSEV